MSHEYRQVIKKDTTDKVMTVSVGMEELTLVRDVADARLDLERALTQLVRNFEVRTGMVVIEVRLLGGASLDDDKYVVPRIALRGGPLP